MLTVTNVSSFFQEIKAAADSLESPLGALYRAQFSPGTDVPAEELASAWNCLVRPGEDAFRTAERLQANLEGAAIGLVDAMKGRLAQLERSIAERLRGDWESQRAAGFIIPGDFTARVTIDHPIPAPPGVLRFACGGMDSLPPGHWLRSAVPLDDLPELSSGKVLVLGPMRWHPNHGFHYRSFYRIAEALQASAQLKHKQDQEAQVRRREIDRDCMEREEAYRQSNLGRIESLERELAELKAFQPRQQ